jgi:hypothetical protein
MSSDRDLTEQTTTVKSPPGRTLIEAIHQLELPASTISSLLDIPLRDAIALHHGDLTLPSDHSRRTEVTLLIDLYVRLATLLHGAPEASAWIRVKNESLGGTPLELLTTPSGLRSVLGYIRARLF